MPADPVQRQTALWMASTGASLEVIENFNGALAEQGWDVSELQDLNDSIDGYSPAPMDGGSTFIPQPRILIEDHNWQGESSFNGDTMRGRHGVFVQAPDFNEEVFSTASEPRLELGWYRNGAFRWPDDPVLKSGSDQGGGTQSKGSGETALIRRSKWSVNGEDFETIGRIELEHYFKIQEVKLLDSASRAYDDQTSKKVSIPVPTFIAPVAITKYFTERMYDTMCSVPRYIGYKNAYFAFRYTVKDLKSGAHPGDRVTGPISKTIMVRAADANNGYRFPIWPKADGFADGESSNGLEVSHV